MTPSRVRLKLRFGYPLEVGGWARAKAASRANSRTARLFYCAGAQSGMLTQEQTEESPRSELEHKGGMESGYGPVS